MPKTASRLACFLSVSEVAEHIGVSDRTVFRWIKDGKLHVHRFGTRVRIAEDDAIAFTAGLRR